MTARTAMSTILKMRVPVLAALRVFQVLKLGYPLLLDFQRQVAV